MSLRPLLFVLALTVFFVGATEFMLAPMLTPLAHAFGTTAAQAAWLVSSYACAYAIAAPCIGLIADRLDRRRVLLPALLVSALDGVALTIAPTFAAAVLLRVIGGVASAALIPTTFALIAEVVPPARRAGAMGHALLGMTLGIAAGPTLAGVLTARFGWRAPFLATAAGCVITFFVARRHLPRRTRPTQSAQPQSPPDPTPHPTPAPTPDPAPDPALDPRPVAIAVAVPHGHRSRNRNRRALRASLLALTSGALLRPLIAKGLWLGAAVAGFLLSGEILRARAGLSTAQVGGAVSLFGAGLALGNLIVGRMERRIPRPETLQIVSLLVMMLALIAAYMMPFRMPLDMTPQMRSPPASQMPFAVPFPAPFPVLLPVPFPAPFAVPFVAPFAASFLTSLPGPFQAALPWTLAAIALLGLALGLAAPASTALLAARAGADSGLVLSVSESLNNVVLLALLPVAAHRLARGAIVSAGALLIGAQLAALAILLLDRAAAHPGARRDKIASACSDRPPGC